MPCSDQSEVIIVKLTPREQLENLEIYKLSCSKNAGYPLIIQYIKGITLEKIAESELRDLIPNIEKLPFGQRFFLEKQFWSLKILAETWLGKTTPLNQNFSLESISWGINEIELRGQLQIQNPREQISPCGTCSKCPKPTTNTNR